MIEPAIFFLERKLNELEDAADAMLEHKQWVAYVSATKEAVQIRARLDSARLSAKAVPPDASPREMLEYLLAEARRLRAAAVSDRSYVAAERYFQKELSITRDLQALDVKEAKERGDGMTDEQIIAELVAVASKLPPAMRAQLQARLEVGLRLVT